MKKLLMKTFLVSVFVIGLFACGSTGGNDLNGTSLSCHGFYTLADPAGDFSVEDLVGLSYFQSSLANEDSGNLTWVGITNHLAGQAVTLRRVKLSYQVVGSDLQVPSTEVVINTILAPRRATAGGTGAAGSSSSNVFGGDSTLPDSFTPIGGDDKPYGTSIYYGMRLVPRSIQQFLSLNRNSLPARPFTLIVTAQGIGVTSAGKEISTNYIQIEGDIYNDEIPVSVTAEDAAEETEEATETPAAEFEDTTTSDSSGDTTNIPNFEPL